MGVFYAILAIVVFAVLGVTYKLSDKLNCDQRHVNLFMFLSAAVVMLIWGLASGGLGLSWTALGIGLSMGLVCFSSVCAFRKACTLGRISTSWTVLNLALVVPVAASIFIWGEHPGPKHLLGLSLTVVAVVLIGMDIARAGE